MKVLSKLFGSPARVKMMRLFLLNPEKAFTRADIKGKSQVTSEAITKEITALKAAGLIKPKSFLGETPLRNGTMKKKRVSGWCLDDSFRYLEPLKSLVINSDSFNKQEITRRFRSVGKVKLLILSGIFLENEQSTVDILLVGDGLRKNAFGSALRALESEAGYELRYAILDTEDFMYRVDLYDRFIRDILDFPHEKLINKLNV